MRPFALLHPKHKIASDRAFLKPLIQVALLTGLRQCELIALKKQSVDFSCGRLYVANPKWKKDPRRTQGNPMSQDTREILLRLAREVEGEYFFTHDQTGARLTRGVIDTAFRRVCLKAKVFNFRFHDLRHSFGTRLGDADVSLEKIARLMGHSNIRMTLRYVHPTDEALQRAVEHAKSSRIVPGALSPGKEQERKALQATG